MMQSWLMGSFTALALVAFSAVGMYVSLLLLTRIAGLRSFSKMSSFDFAITVAIGSTIAGTIIAENPPLIQGIVALVSLYTLQMVVAKLRRRFALVSEHVDNSPILLMAGSRIIEENLRVAHMSEGDLRSKLRAANVLNLNHVRAVIMETTGDVSVLHSTDGSPPLDARLLEGVRGADQLERQSGPS